MNRNRIASLFHTAKRPRLIFSFGIPIFMLLFGITFAFFGSHFVQLVHASFGTWGDSSLIHACKDSRGVIFLVAPNDSCDASETQVTWLKDVNAGSGLNITRNSSGATLSLANIDGWTNSSDAWTYVSTNSFKITNTDRTAIFTKGTRIKLSNNSMTYHGVVISSSYSTDTTVTLAPNDDYSLSNSAITNTYYSYEANPQGYPTWFSYTPTLTWTGTPPTGTPVTLSMFKIDGNSCTLNISYYNYTAGSNITALKISIPVEALGVNAATGNIRNGDTPNLTIGYVYPGSIGGLILYSSSVAATGFEGMTTYRF